MELLERERLLANMDLNLAEVGAGSGVFALIGGEAEQGVIDPDVLWSCTTCGACVEQCPVDIEHVDHIVDMRRYQVMIESNFPSEAGVMLRNISGGWPMVLASLKSLLETGHALTLDPPICGAEAKVHAQA